MLIYTRTRYSILTNMMCCHAQWFFVVVCLKLWIRFIWFDKKWADVMLLLMHFVDVHRLCRPILFFEPFFFLSSCMLLFFICCCFSSASNKSLNSLFVCVCVYFSRLFLVDSFGFRESIENQSRTCLVHFTIYHWHWANSYLCGVQFNLSEILKTFIECK